MAEVLTKKAEQIGAGGEGRGVVGAACGRPPSDHHILCRGGTMWPPTITAPAGLSHKIATVLEELRRHRIVINVCGPGRR